MYKYKSHFPHLEFWILISVLMFNATVTKLGKFWSLCCWSVNMVGQNHSDWLIFENAGYLEYEISKLLGENIPGNVYGTRSKVKGPSVLSVIRVIDVFLLQVVMLIHASTWGGKKCSQYCQEINLCPEDTTATSGQDSKSVSGWNR